MNKKKNSCYIEINASQDKVSMTKSGGHKARLQIEAQIEGDMDTIAHAMAQLMLKNENFAEAILHGAKHYVEQSGRLDEMIEDAKKAFRPKKKLVN